MTRAELVGMLEVERHLPLPTHAEPEPVFEPDTAENQRRRCAALSRDLHTIAVRDRKGPMPVAPTRSAPGLRLVKKGLIFVADRSAA